MIMHDKKPKSAEVMFSLAEAYVIEDYANETGKELMEVDREEFTAYRRKLEVWTLNSAIDMDDPGSWASSGLLDAIKFMNGRSLEQVPNLHFLAEEKYKELQGSDAGSSNRDLNAVAMDLANQEIRNSCEAWLKDCGVSCTLEDVLTEKERKLEMEYEEA